MLLGTEPLFQLSDSDVLYSDVYVEDVENYDDPPTGPPVIPPIVVASFAPSLEEAMARLAPPAGPPPSPPSLPAPAPAAPGRNDAVTTQTEGGPPRCGEGCLAVGSFSGRCRSGSVERACVLQ